MPCPFCGSSSSSVVKSRGLVSDENVRRRRECADCGRRFPTSERLDRELLEHELGDRGLQLPDLLAGPPDPTWSNAEKFLHRLWGQAKDGQYVKSDWRAFQHVIDGLKRHA